MRPLAKWLAPCPLWTDFMERSSALMRRPVLLRFASDSFMEELQALLADEPENMLGLVAQPEDWRNPRVGLAPLESAGGAAQAVSGPLTLYQPVHQRFYLVAAALVCRMPGLPERSVLQGEGERVGFVLRRVEPQEGGSEADLGDADRRRVFAWVPGRPTGRWVEAQKNVLLADEERLPLFPLDSPRLERQLWAGLVPVARRQSYATAAVVESTAAAAQLLDFRRDVLEPWGELDDWVYGTPSPDPAVMVGDYYASGAVSDAVQAEFAYGVRLNSALILADFAKQLEKHLPRVRDALRAGDDQGLGSAARTLYTDLNTAAGGGGPTLFHAMVAAADNAAAFEKLQTGEAFPSGYAPVRLDDWRWRELIQHDPSLPSAPDDPPAGPRRLKKHLQDALVEAVEDPVRQTGKLPADAAPAAAERAPVQSPADPAGESWYVIQYVYERPQCGRNCTPIVSETTEPFRLASFFDPAAPARTLPVALPVDTSPAALRKHDRNVVFMLSDELRRQISRVKSMKDLVDGNIGEADASVGFGVACSLSIPIITICALILLMIMVSVLNIVFWWLPFFKICFPIPKLTAKKA